MKSIYLIIIILAFKIDSKESNNRFELITRNGTININCEIQDECQIQVNNNTIKSIYNFYGTLKTSITNIENKDLDLSLIRVHNGDGCPSMYFLIQIMDDNSFVVTKEFGNCNTIGDVVVYKKQIQFNFAGDIQSSRKKSIYKYSFQNHKIEKM